MTDFDELRHQAAELDVALADARYSGRSPDGVATATVTGQGKLVGLTISDAALDGPHTQGIGVAVVQAVTAARKVASDQGLPQIRALFDPAQTWVPSRAPHSEPAPVARPARPEPDEVEESYDEIDFIDDDPYDNDDGGGRW